MSEGAAKKEEKPRKFQAIRGTRDLLPPETALWNRVEQTAHEVFGTFGFGEIRLPIFEPTDLFARSVGGETDIVSKEMYTFEDRPEDVEKPQTFQDFERYVKSVQQLFEKGRIPKSKENEEAIRQLERTLKKVSDAHARHLFDTGMVATAFYWANAIKLGDELSLRPEATASVCRAYIEHNMQQLTQPVKLYYMGPMFRRERPQKGRYRQFYQIGAEVLEATRPDAARDVSKELAKDAAVDAEVIEMLTTFFDRVGLVGTELSINSIGHSAKNCRPSYVAKLRAELLKVKDKFGPDSQRRIETNPLRVLDSKVKEEQSIIANLPHIADHICEDCKTHLAELKRQLDLRGVPYRENWRLVRGLDYYMRTTFEITARGLGSQDAVCGGGRYDGLVELLGGPPTKGIGFAIGEDRLVLSLQETITEVGDAFDETLPTFSTVLQRPDVAVTGTSAATWDHAVKLATSLRRRGLSVFIPKSGTKLQRVFDAASRLGIRVAIIVGENELKRHDYVIRVLSPLEPTGLRDFAVKSHDVLTYGKLVKLRQDLERGLLRLSTGIPDLNARRNISFVVERLAQKDLLPAKLIGAITAVVPILNRAIHGESLAPDSVEWALAYGNLLVNELEKLSPSEV